MTVMTKQIAPADHVAVKVPGNDRLIKDSRGISYGVVYRIYEDGELLELGPGRHYMVNIKCRPGFTRFEAPILHESHVCHDR